MRRRTRRGLHVAPFRSLEGLPVLVATDRDGRLLALVEVAPPARAGSWDDAAALRQSAEATVRPLARGVHPAPWRPAELLHGVAFVAVDARGRLVASMDAPSPSDEPGVRSNLAAVLDALETEEAPTHGV